MTLIEQLELHEGRRRKPYVDTVGKLTIGIGRNLTDKGLSEDEIDYLLQNDVRECLDDLDTFPWFAGLDPARRKAVIDLRFNLGPTKFRTFRKFLAAMAAGDHAAAEQQLVKTKWITQVQKSRSDRIRRHIATGVDV